jgi:hypothetical protein
MLVPLTPWCDGGRIGFALGKPWAEFYFFMRAPVLVLNRAQKVLF